MLKRQLNLLERFSLLSLLSVCAFCVALGFVTSDVLTRNMLDSEWQGTAELVRYQVRAYGLTRLFTDASLRTQPERYRASLSALLDLPEVVKVKVWDSRGTVLWATDREIIGRRFPDDQDLRTALDGRIAVRLKPLTKTEHQGEQDRTTRFAEIYVPIFEHDRAGPVIGVLEIYKVPARLSAAIRRVGFIVWAAVLAGGLALYASLFWIVRVAYRKELWLEQTLTERSNELRERNERTAALDGFIHTVAHDLKAPLVTIQGMAGIVMDDHAAALDAEGRRYVERIQVNAGRMQRLLTDLLALARIGRDARPAEPVDLAELVRDVLRDLAPRLNERGITAVVGPLPTVHAVPVHMEQVFRNLLTNAVKYMGDAPAPTIEVGAIDRGSEVECWVRDTGIGIDGAYHDTIFEIFQRLHTIDAEGTGVGLPIVKKIVEAAGGRIAVESAPGQGSTFRFTWPAVAR